MSRSEGDGPAVKVGRPVGSVIAWPVRSPPGPSDAQHFDRLLADPALRRVIAAQPERAWRRASVTNFSGEVRLKATSSRFERPFTARAPLRGSAVRFDVPGPADRARVYPTAPAELPGGIRIIPEPEGAVATRDVLPGRLRLPTGRVVVDSYFTDESKPLAQRAGPGDHPFRVTLARPVDGKYESVALATLAVSERPTVRWRYVQTVGVDGGTAAFSSAEGAKARASLFDAGEDAWLAAYDADGDASAAHTWAADRPSGRGTNLMTFSTGYGDGGYSLFVGLDAEGRPTRYVLDCLLLHLAWPRADRG